MGVQPKKSSRLFILLGAILTLLSMGGVYFIANKSSKSPTAGATTVLVAKAEVPAHTTFTSLADVDTWFVPAQVSSATTPPESFSGAATFVKEELSNGKISTSETIYPKEVVLPSMLTNIGSRENLDVSYNLGKNQLAESIQASVLDESGGAIQAGDYVDLIASYLPNGGGGGGAVETPSLGGKGQTQFVLQDLKVLALGQWSASESTSTSSTSSGSTMLTFGVNHKTALVLQHLKDFSGSWLLSVALRSASSNKHYVTTPVNGTYFFGNLRDNFTR